MNNLSLIDALREVLRHSHHSLEHLYHFRLNLKNWRSVHRNNKNNVSLHPQLQKTKYRLQPQIVFPELQNFLTHFHDLYYQGLKRKDREQIALNYLDDVGLKEWATHLPSELSGGQKQRVAIARAMASKPKVLLADEPTGALDSKTSHEVMALIQDINKSGKTILIVTHEEDIAKMCTRIVRLKDGIIVEDKKNKMVKAN